MYVTETACSASKTDSHVMSAMCLEALDGAYGQVGRGLSKDGAGNGENGEKCSGELHLLSSRRMYLVDECGRGWTRGWSWGLRSDIVVCRDFIPMPRGYGARDGQGWLLQSIQYSP